MPTDSKAKKFSRRIRRDRSVAYRMLDVAIAQRDEARTMVMFLQNQLQKYIPAPKTEPVPANEIPVINEPQQGPAVE